MASLDTIDNEGKGLAGPGASTTGNIYGIYDMSGGAWDFVMGVLADSDGNPRSGSTSALNSGFNGKLTDKSDYKLGINFPDSRYYDLYISDNATTACDGVCYGHALSETAGWYGDVASFINDKSVWIYRAGANYYPATAGLFSLSLDFGRALDHGSFYIVLVV